MIHLQTFIIYSISVITIIIIDRRQSIIKINFIIKTWGAKKINFIERSIPKLITFHIINIKGIQRRYTYKPYLPGNGAKNSLMSTHASIIVDYVGPPSAEVCRTTTISLKW